MPEVYFVLFFYWDSVFDFKVGCLSSFVVLSVLRTFLCAVARSSEERLGL